VVSFRVGWVRPGTPVRPIRRLRALRWAWTSAFPAGFVRVGTPVRPIRRLRALRWAWTSAFPAGFVRVGRRHKPSGAYGLCVGRGRALFRPGLCVSDAGTNHPAATGSGWVRGCRSLARAGRCRNAGTTHPAPTGSALGVDERFSGPGLCVSDAGTNHPAATGSGWVRGLPVACSSWALPERRYKPTGAYGLCVGRRRVRFRPDLCVSERRHKPSDAYWTAEDWAGWCPSGLGWVRPERRYKPTDAYGLCVGRRRARFRPDLCVSERRTSHPALLDCGGLRQVVSFRVGLRASRTPAQTKPAPTDLRSAAQAVPLRGGRRGNARGASRPGAYPSRLKTAVEVPRFRMLASTSRQARDLRLALPGAPPDFPILTAMGAYPAFRRLRARGRPTRDYSPIRCDARAEPHAGRHAPGNA